jgi:soluble lytic murein transglycosylase-like protein
MMRSKIGIMAITAALLASSAVSARAKRTVVLLDFSQVQSASASTNETTGEAVDVDALSRLMARQFTGASDPGSPIHPSFQPAMYRSAVNPSALANPFVSRAWPRVLASPAVYPPSMSECLLTSYQPSYGFGRRAEERRRVIFPLVQRAACETGLPVGLFDAVIMQESRYNPTIVSPKGAFGLAQLMPGTAVQLGVDRYSLSENLRGGARYLRQHVDQFGRYDLALAAYNAGPHRKSLRSGFIPKIAETQNYVRTILANWSGVMPPVATAAHPLNVRQAQMIFMAYRISE